MRTTFVASLLVLAACGEGVATTAADRAGSQSGALGAATLDFRSNGVFASALNVGDTATVTYDASRLSDCRGDQNGHPAWSITGFWQLGGGEVHSFEAGGYSPSGGTQPATVPLAAAGDLQLWFQITNVWGCSAWDSNYGANFHFNVTAQAEVDFAADWSVTTVGTLRAGAPITVNYDLSRLPKCRQDYNSLPTWDVLMYYRFDGGSVQSVSVTRTSDMFTRVSTPTAVQAPAGARDFEAWFYNSDRGGCVGYDSDYGANFHFALR